MLTLQPKGIMLMFDRFRSSCDEVIFSNAQPIASPCLLEIVGNGKCVGLGAASGNNWLLAYGVVFSWTWSVLDFWIVHFCFKRKAFAFVNKNRFRCYKLVKLKINTGQISNKIWVMQVRYRITYVQNFDIVSAWYCDRLGCDVELIQA
jgi:hypothetical protein